MRITQSTPDDWVFIFRCRSRRTRREFDRVIGVNGWVPFDRALKTARATVEPPRAKRERRTPIILGVEWCRWHQWIERGRMDLKNTGDVIDTMKV